MREHHYLGHLPKIGETLWYVASWREQWVALLSFSASALKCAARDRWIGWSFHQLQAGILLAEAPTDPAIACRALQCRGRKAQQRDPLLPPARHVPKRFSNLGQMAQVVMLSHELLVARLFAGMNEPHHHLAQFRTRSRVTALGTHSRVRIQGQDRAVQENL